MRHKLTSWRSKHFRRVALSYLSHSGQGLSNRGILKVLKSRFPDFPSGSRKDVLYNFFIERLKLAKEESLDIPDIFERKPKLKKQYRRDFYESDEWRLVRYQALLKSNGCCDCCGARPIKGKPLHVDHIKPRSLYPSLELVLSNLQVLCADCNLGKSNLDETDWRGNVVPFKR